MASYIISELWYNEIKDLIEVKDPYFFEEDGRKKVELDVNEEEFNRVSIELGWM